MSNGYFLADTNSLVYAYRAGGPELLDEYINIANGQKRIFAITDTVRNEIRKGPLEEELLEYIADRRITVLPAQDTQQRIRAGTLSPISAGEASMLEVAAKESEVGRVTRIWSDDKYFDSDQIMRKSPDAHRSMSAELLDEAYEQKFIGVADHQKFRAGYEAQQVFIDSQRLSSFRYDLSTPDLKVSEPQISSAPMVDEGNIVRTGISLSLAKAAIGAGVLATAYDAATTGTQARDLLQQNNPIGAKSEVMQFGARNAGAWGGALIGAKAGTLAGIESGPGMLVTGIVGAGIGAWGAERVVGWIEQNKINTQMDRNGVEWRFDPENAEKGWQREVVDAFAERGLSLKHMETAPSDIADELNFKASTMAVQLRLSSPDIAINPFEIAGDATDTRSLRESPWIRQPDTKVWHREVADGMIDRTMHTYTDKAIGEKAAELDAYAQSVIAYNAARSPAAVAAHFEGVYRDNGWERHGDGQLPPAVRHARQDLETLVASDGDRYRRQQTGEWVSDGLIHDSTAQGNLRDELNATHRVLQTRLMPAPLSQSVQEPAIGIEARALDPASEQQRDAREQAQREANRQGLSQDQVQQAVQGVTATIAMRGASSAHAADIEVPVRHDDAREREAAQRARTDAPAPVPPDFAPSQQGLRDLRDPQHEGQHALREMQYRAALFETQQHIPHGPHTQRLGASMLAFAVENKLQYSDVRLVKNHDTGQIELEHARCGQPTQRFSVDLAAMSSQPIEASSQRINEAVSKHNASAAPALERTHEQAQGLGGYALNDKVMFGCVRGGTPGHISDDHVALAVRMAKEEGINANNIAHASMVGDQIRLLRSGPDEKTVLVDVSKPAPPLQDSVNAVNTLNQQQALTLAQQQDQPTQNDPDRGPKGPKL